MTSPGKISDPPPATLCIALSGRAWAWPMTASFLDKQTWPRHRIALRLLDTSQSAAFHQLVRDWLAHCDYADAALVAKSFGPSGLADRDRPGHEDEVRGVCAGIYAYFAGLAETPLVFVLEDDVQPPPDVFERLQAHLGGGVISASGHYLGRLTAEPIAWHWDEDGQPVTARPQDAAGRVGGHGFGAAVFDGKIFQPGRFHSRAPLKDFDFNFFHQLVAVEKKSAVVDWNCLCRHYPAPGVWVQNPRTALGLRLLPGDPASVNVVHLNAYDQHGGAERFAAQLIGMQRNAGHTSTALVGHKTRPDSPAIPFDTAPDPAARSSPAAGGWPDYEFRGSHALTRHEAVAGADVVHAHNLYGGYFHPHSLMALSWFRPVVWSIHDMQALTGYCSHALDCPKWRTGCGDCPDLTRPGPALSFDNTAALWRDKKLIADNSRLWIAAGSRWMASQIQESLLGRHPVRHIPNGIDTRLFQPAERAPARGRMGLPEDALIVGSLARSGVFAHPWKGGKHAREVVMAMRQRHPNMVFLNIGAEEADPEPWIVPFASSQPEDICDALGALDLFLHPSIADTAPLAVLEAMACGLPVVGFQTGGIPEMVTEDEGILVPCGDTQALILAAQALAADAGRRRRMGIAARARAVECFDVSRMADAYLQLYHEAIVGHAGDGLPRHTSPMDPDTSRLLGELEALHGDHMRLKHKLRENRAKQDREQARILELLNHGWLRCGRGLGIFRGPLKQWIKRRSHTS